MASTHTRFTLTVQTTTVSIHKGIQGIRRRTGMATKKAPGQDGAAKDRLSIRMGMLYLRTLRRHTGP